MYDHEGHHDGKQVTRHWCRECGEIIAAWEFNLSIEENYCVAVTGDPALPDGVPSPLPHQLAGLHQVRGGGPRAGRALLQGAQQGS